MTVRFREARRDDVAAIVSMLADDVLGQGREAAELEPYLVAFDAMQDEPHNLLIVGVDTEGQLVATYQLTLISGLSLSATRRAQIESVRVASHLRGAGVGTQMLEDAKTRARAAGCGLLQLTMNQSRSLSHRFYEAQGFEASHVGFKFYLD